MKVRHVTRRDGDATTGEALKAARLKAKISQDALAAQLKLKSGRRGIIRWEKDENRPDAAHQRQLVRILSLPADFFESGARVEARLSLRVAALEEAVAQLERQLSGEDAARGQ